MPTNCANASVVAVVLFQRDQRVLFLDGVAQFEQRLDVLEVVNGGYRDLYDSSLAA